MPEIEEIFNKKSEQAYKCFFCKDYFTKKFVKEFGLRGTEKSKTQIYYTCNKCIDRGPPCA